MQKFSFTLHILRNQASTNKQTGQCIYYRSQGNQRLSLTQHVYIFALYEQCHEETCLQGLRLKPAYAAKEAS